MNIELQQLQLVSLSRELQPEERRQPLSALVLVYPALLHEFLLGRLQLVHLLVLVVVGLLLLHHVGVLELEVLGLE